MSQNNYSDIKKSLEFAEENELVPIPLRFKDKKPKFPWKAYQKQKPPHEKIKKWFPDNVPTNLAFLCGEISGGANKAFVVLDFDDLDLYNAVRPNGSITRAVRTSKGVHEYITLSDSVKSFSVLVKKDDGTEMRIDIQGEGSYIVAPGSIHPTGIVYRWKNHNPILFFEDATSEQFIQRLFHRLDITCMMKGWKIINHSVEHNIEDIQKGIKEGSRNNNGYLLACYNRQNDLAKEQTIESLLEWNERNIPPLMQTEIYRIVESAYKTDAKYGFKFIDPETDQLEKYQMKGKFSPNLIGNHLMSIFNFITLKDTSEILYYNNGLYYYGGEAVIKEECKRLCKGELNKYQTNEVIFQIQSSTFTHRELLNRDRHLIHLENGIFDLDKMELSDFQPNLLSTSRIPVVYDTKAKYPRFESFLNDILEDGDIKIIQELFGYCLYRGYPIQKAFLLIGEGANGKSTLLAVLRELLGIENISGIALQELETNRFASSELYNKLANLYPDLTDRTMKMTGRFKMLTGGDFISAEKKFKGHFNFVNYAKLVFSANKIPQTYDDTDAFFRRWVIINFPNVFGKDKEADKFILNEITSAKELSGILNWAIEGLKRLLIQGDFSYSKTVDDIRSQYIKMSNSLQGFIEDCVDYDPDGWISKEEFYNAFTHYCRKNKLPIKAKAVVGRELPQYVRVIVERKKINREYLRGWKGIKIINLDPTEFSHHVPHVQEKL